MIGRGLRGVKGAAWSLFRLNETVHTRALPSFHSQIRRISNDTNSDVNPELKRQRDQHLEQLKKYYPPSLIKSILAAEASISPETWEKRSRPPLEFAPIYKDDYASYDPLYDFASQEWIDKDQPQQPIPQRVPHGELLGSQDLMAYGMNLSKLEQQTGLSPDYVRHLTVSKILTKVVRNMTRKGKTRGYYSIIVVGDKRGHVGVGEGTDSREGGVAAMRAIWNGVKNLRYVPRFEDRTIYGSIQHKYHSVLLELRSAPAGSGLRVNRVIYEICKCAGIKDLVGNVYRSRNPMNVCKAAIEALVEKQNIAEDIASSRGRKIVDVTKTYYDF